MGWMDEYPHTIYASVLLLDGKIENWKVASYRWKEKEEVKAYWKKDRLDDYEVKSIGFEVYNDEDHEFVFSTLAIEWLKQWPHADDFRLGKAY